MNNTKTAAAAAAAKKDNKNKTVSGGNHSSSRKVDSRSQTASGSNDLCGNNTIKKKQRKFKDRWDAILFCETWRLAKSETWEDRPTDSSTHTSPRLHLLQEADQEAFPTISSFFVIPSSISCCNVAICSLYILECSSFSCSSSSFFSFLGWPRCTVSHQNRTLP